MAGAAPAVAPPRATVRPDEPDSPPRSGAGRAVIALVLVVVALSAVVRLVNLDVFPTLVFDEHYYVHDAGSVIHGRIGPRQPAPWKPGDERSLAHPPLATLTIATGILTLGDGPWGWRVPSAVAGTLLIALVYPLARRLRLSPSWALAAVVLAASDTMLIVESRIGVLDPFVALWSAVCIYCALRYVQSGRPARWLVLTGLSGGLAIASKWSGLLALVAAIAIVAVDWGRERREQPRGAAVDAGERGANGAREAALAASVAREAAPEGGAAGAGAGEAAGAAGRLTRAVACLLGLPLVVYLASYADYFASGHSFAQWLHLQRYMATFNWTDRGTQTFASRPITWIFDATPIWYRWGLVPHGVLGLVAIGNPLLWWASIAALIGLLWLAWKRHDGRLAVAPLLVVILYLPWLATSRQTYIYYLTPVAPFLAIAVATALSRLAGPAPLGGRRAALFFAAGAAFMAVAAGGTLAVRIGATAALLAFVAAAVVTARRRSSREASAARLESPQADLLLRATTRRTGDLPAAAAWLYTGAVAGLAAAWLPFLVSYAASFGYYQRLTWFTSWR